MIQPMSEKIRYAVVGAGWISQAAFLPAVEQTGNSVVTTLVTGDPEKAKVLKEQYNIPYTCSYDDYSDILKNGEVDAVYLAVPNNLHLKYGLPALEAGLHLLLEKPMALNRKECELLIRAAEQNNVKLMIAYRLHNEPCTLDVIDMVQYGKIGNPRIFTSTFTQIVTAENHRLKPEHEAGPLMDMGPYPINAVRNIFQDEPLEVFATETRFNKIGFERVAETVAVTLRFPEDRVAQFSVSFGTSPISEYRITGTKGNILVNPGYTFQSDLKAYITIDEKTEEKVYPQTDQFGGELQYFSQCILNNQNPEPDGYEGLADIVVISAIRASLISGRSEPIPPIQITRRPNIDQEIILSPTEEPPLVNAAEP
jgi:predicted dehydrogenase